MYMEIIGRERTLNREMQIARSLARVSFADVTRTTKFLRPCVSSPAIASRNFVFCANIPSNRGGKSTSAGVCIAGTEEQGAAPERGEKNEGHDGGGRLSNETGQSAPIRIHDPSIKLQIGRRLIGNWKSPRELV